jgi:hypothetical protein
MWLLLSEHVLEVAWWLLELLLHGAAFSRVSDEANPPVPYIKRRPWWPPASKPTAQ